MTKAINFGKIKPDIKLENMEKDPVKSLLNVT